MGGAKVRNEKRGRFIVIEGTDGSGKSTISEILKTKLESSGLTIVKTREPGGPPLSEEIRNIILQRQMSAWTELFLYEAARAEHVNALIKPNLRVGNWVLSDRFSASSIAYQGLGRGLPVSEIRKINKLACQGVLPDLTVFLDLPPEEALARVKTHTRFESEGMAFASRARRGFLAAKKFDSRSWLHLKVKNKSPEELLEQILIRLRKEKWIRQ